MPAVPTSLLQLKLHPPQPTGLFVSRARLLDRLDEILDVPFTVIVAPAGFGKTSLVTEWLNTKQQTAGWISLDRNDGDLTRFTRYFVAAMRSVYPEAGTTSWMLLNGFAPLSPTSMAEALLQDLAQLPGALLIVLDDYHRAETPEINELLRHLLHIPPPHLHLVLTTRSDPALPLGRLRSRFQLVEIRTQDLRFSLAEATHFLNLLVDRLVDQDDVVRLQEQTEGWAVGLQLAGLLLHRGHVQSELATQLSTRSHQWVVDYLADEVLTTIPPEKRSILFQSAILDRFCAPLLEAVLVPLLVPGSGSSILDYLQTANLFLIPLDNARTWFRFHHLFRAFLRRNLTATMTEEDIRQLHLRSSGWFERHGLIDDAIEHARLAGDGARVLQLIERGMYRVLNEEDLHQLDRWLALVPEVTDTRPAILIAQAFRQ
ncbi:MAG: helix-turn-helix transcriptional regulator, partial [Anaerolineae bacterium]|nr:helix-turn-helix transcriptional regulator [Anaerolineae bacterium]